MPATTQKNIKGTEDEKTGNTPAKDGAYVYAKINEEIAALMTKDDLIVFSPAEDFEYKAPLEDFKKNRTIGTK